MKLSLEKINKNLLLIALVAMLFRIGNFATTYIPKPFELFVILLVLLTAIDALKNKRIKEYIFSIPRNIRTALIIFVFSILFGWFISTTKGEPSTFNMILEFGSFCFSLSIFLLVLFNTRNDFDNKNKYFYALLASVVYIIFIIFPQIAYKFNLAAGHFNGFTTNPNIVSKIMLIPIIFFSAKSLFESNNKLKFIFVLIASSMVALLLWTASRGAIFSMILGVIFVWLILSCYNFSWKKLFLNGVVIFSIVVMGFIFTPHEGKRIISSRILNLEYDKIVHFKTEKLAEEVKNIEDKSTEEVKKNKLIKEVKDAEEMIGEIKKTEIKSIKETEKTGLIEKIERVNTKIASPFKNFRERLFRETRFRIWSFYLNKIIRNPLGFGPNTHMASYILLENGQYENTGPHNTYFQAWLWGGLIGIFSFSYILFSAFKNLKMKAQTDFDIITISLMGILFTLSVSIMFDDSLSFHWFWAILALSLRK